MGFEIKNICTLVPNPYHPSYKTDKDHYYFSLFITPRLQFDGTLKEFYEMLHWPEYAAKIFWKYKLEKGKFSDELDENIHDPLSTCFLSSADKKEIFIKKDYELLKPLLSGMKIIDDTKNEEIGFSEISDFLDHAKKIWKKLFHENVPVEAWPIYLKPQISEISRKITNLTDEIRNKEDIVRSKIDSLSGKISSASANQIRNNPEDILKPVFQNPISIALVRSDGQAIAKATVSDISKNALDIKQAKEEREKLKQTQRKDNFELSKFRQEFHKKISALARYPHILRVLGLIQDFKVEKSQVTDIKTSDFLLRMKFDTTIRSTKSEDYPFDEFFESVQFVRPYTKCGCNNNDRLCSHFVTPSNRGDVNIYDGKGNPPVITPNYNEFVLNGFLRTFKNSSKENAVYSIDQEYYEDKSADFSDADLTNDTNVVGFNKKTFPAEDIAVLKQKVADKPKISKGFSIKVHGQPSGILVNMDAQFQKITDENIEEETSAFMAHHLDCGYKVDVSVDNKLEWKSLCEREATYVVDRKDDDWKIPMFGKSITIYHDKNTLFEKLRDEPWLEEVRQIDEDGKANRFEEIARWNGWSLTCPPLHKNFSAPNDEADDMELKEITPPIGSLPKLRFGTDYKFRIRTVDICGNGPDLKDTADDLCIFTYTPNNENGMNDQKGYQRLELINAPTFYPPYELVPGLATASDDEIDKKKKGEGFPIDKLYKGEDNETLVVRSRINNNQPEYIAKDCVRFITAPHITPHFAEISGFLDKPSNNPIDSDNSQKYNPEELYKFLKNAPKHFYKEDEIMDGVPFTTDNVIDEFYINDESTGVKINSRGDLKSKPLRIVLRKSNFIYYFPTTKKNVIHPKFGYLSEGEDKVLTIKSTSSDYPTLIEPKACTKKFKIIHAVQRPFLKSLLGQWINNTISIANYFQFERIIPEPGLYKIEQKYQVAIKPIKVTDKKNDDWKNPFFPFSSTGELILHAEYCDYELNPNNPNGWNYISKDHPKETEKDKERKRQTSTNKTKEADKFYITKSWSNLDETTEENKLDTLLRDVISPGDDKTTSSFTTIKDNFNFFIHSFPDTKFRKVKYRIEAISKFSEFFDIEKHRIDKTDQNPFSVFANLDSSYREKFDPLDNDSSNEYTIIENSSKPSKPNITSIIPVFTTTDINRIYTFEHKTFRIYLGKVWYETGLGEKIAVTYESINPTKETLKNKISIIANDPTTSSDSLYNGSTKNYIDSARVPNDSLNLEIISTNIDSLKNADRISEKLTQAQMEEFGFSTFDVHWDEVQGEFYADIEINQEKLSHYSTLLKFGVCRYQKHSIVLAGFYDYRFSDVVMTDMVSILPNRIISSDPKENILLIKGTQGFRYTRKKQADKTFTIEAKENKLYLIKEDKSEEIIYTKDKKFPIYPLELNQEITLDKLKKLPPNIPLQSFDNFVIEEYEDIPLDDEFSIEDDLTKDSLYNPRNDPRKRLVFFYKLNN
jgi:hypothetical protein